MDFTSLNLPLSIKTTRNDPNSEFFIPVLELANRYDVAVGYFSSNWIRDAAEGIARFACNSGEARWVISHNFTNYDDYQILRDASGQIDKDKTDKFVRQSFEELMNALKQDTRRVLGWLVRDGIMEFRVGIPKNKLAGMLHAKMGVFQDSVGNKIGFSGSYNLTSGAASNWETIEVYCSWRSQEAKERISSMDTDFLEIWNGDDDNLEMFHPSDSALHPFIRETEHSTRPYEYPPNRATQKFQIPAKFLQDGKLRTYQLDAISAWFENECKGVLSMATGSGKTVTALAAATRLANEAMNKSTPLVVVVTVPYQHLADQWVIEAGSFGFEPVKCYGGKQFWSIQAQEIMSELLAGVVRLSFFVAVNNTFNSELFQRILSRHHGDTLLIADEMHNLGASTYRKALPSYVQFRLGLSATPIRHGDEQGTKALENYFGKTVFTFTLHDAIEHKFLCPYYYIPILTPLSEDEMAEYKDLSSRIAKNYAIVGADSDGPSDVLQNLLIKRARLLSRVQSKQIKLQELLSGRIDSSFNLIYCGDSRDESEERQINVIVKLVGYELGLRARKFTCEESATERRLLLEQFENAELQVLVAIRCLDEGVDIPRTETAYILASSSNPRQYIQRRGRVLRHAPGKTAATIYDFIAVPDFDELSRTDPKALTTERRLVRKELQRVNEFAEGAINAGDALRALRSLKIELNLMDI